MSNKSQKDPGRFQINLKDPNTRAFLNSFSGRKSEVVQSALECYMQADNRHTRELRMLVDESMMQIARVQGILGIGSVQTAPTTAPSEVGESPRMPDLPDLPFDLSAVNEEEEEEIFGDIDI